MANVLYLNWRLHQLQSLKFANVLLPSWDTWYLAILLNKTIIPSLRYINISAVWQHSWITARDSEYSMVSFWHSIDEKFSSPSMEDFERFAVKVFIKHEKPTPQDVARFQALLQTLLPSLTGRLTVEIDA